MKSIYLAHGFSEGEQHAKQLVGALKASGYSMTNSPKLADIVIAHSGGLYTLPLDVINKTLLVVGPTYWEGKSLRSSFAENVRAGFSSRTSLAVWTLKMFWHIWYAIKSPKTVMLMYKNWRYKELWIEKLNRSPATITVVRNKDDAFCSPAIKQSLGGSITYFELPGGHDDLWTNPKPYLELLK